MSKENSLQINFLNKIKELIPQNHSLSDELADVLGISSDSIYRRIRGETLLNINEIFQICTHYNISFDLFTHHAKNIAFNYDAMGSSAGFRTYLTSILNDMLQIERAGNSQIIYAAIDVPIFHHFKYPELSAFKMFYWMKAVVNVASLLEKKFDARHIRPEFAELGNLIFETYCRIPSIEIWTDETINSLIKQIEFYWDSGNFESQEDALIVCEQAKLEIETLNKQAEISNKNLNKKTSEENFTLYHSQIEIGNNCILTKKGDVESIYLSVHTFNKIITGNPGFVDDTKIWLNNLIKKSNPISGVSQIHRYKFFQRALEKIDRLNNKILENR